MTNRFLRKLAPDLGLKGLQHGRSRELELEDGKSTCMENHCEYDNFTCWAYLEHRSLVYKYIEIANICCIYNHLCSLDLFVT